jgi:hypothetical protein
MVGQDASGQTKVQNVAPLRVVPDHEQPPPRAAHRDVEKVGGSGSPVAGVLRRLGSVPSTRMTASVSPGPPRCARHAGANVATFR